MNNPQGKTDGASQVGMSGLTTRGVRARRRTILLSVVVVVIIASIAGYAIHRYQVAPFNTVVLEVNDAKIEMRYFLKRVAISGEPAIKVLNTLTREQMIKQAAGNPPFNISITREDIDRFARELAGSSSAPIEEDEFREWYRQQLNETRLSDAEFEDLLRTGLLSVKMEQYLTRFVPATAEQVFVNMIPVADFSEGATIKERYEAGKDFAALAREHSVDPVSGEAGGKIGWFPQGVLESELDTAAFGLKIGSISDPIPLHDQYYVVMMISEKAAARAIDERSLVVLESKVLEKWYEEAYKDFEVHFHGFSNGYDSETDAWVNWQLKRMQRDNQRVRVPD